jgi:Starch-binding associating with outer membrane
MKSLKLITAVAVIAFSVSSCTKKLDEAYANPNAPVKVKPSELLPPLQYQMAINTQEDFMYMGTTAQVFADRYTLANVPAVTRDRTIVRHEQMGYFANVDNSGNIWRMHYWNLGQNLNRMIDWAAEDNLWDYVGAGYAIQAWSWLTLTDYHGEVILDEAYNTSLLAFKYNTQDQVYNHVRNLCTKALENFDKPVTGSDFATADQWFYGGDINKWKKFVYGVLARTYSHLSNKSTFKADSVIYYCDKAMQTPGEDATYKYAGGVVNNQNNYWGRFRANNVTLRQSKYIADLMQGTQGVGSTFAGVDDPRKWYMLTTGTGVDVNNIFGIEATKGELTLSATQRPVNFYGAAATPTVDTARFIFRDNAEFPFMTSSEIQFMKAEAAFRKGDKTTALAAYKQGVSQHFDMLLSKYNVNIRAGRSMTTATRDAFIADTRVVPATAGALTLSHIMQQKFIALWGFGVLETWTDLRRYHYRDLDPSTGAQVYFGFVEPQGTDLWPDNGGKKSYRVRPRFNSEYVWNIAELSKFGGNLPDYHTKEMWFSLP